MIRVSRMPGDKPTSAAAEKVAALLTEEYLEERAKRASGGRFRAVLAKVPRVSPVPEDDLRQNEQR